MRRAVHSSKESYRLWKMITELNKRPWPWMGWKSHWKSKVIKFKSRLMFIWLVRHAVHRLFSWKVCLNHSRDYLLFAVCAILNTQTALYTDHFCLSVCLSVGSTCSRLLLKEFRFVIEVVSYLFPSFLYVIIYMELTSNAETFMKNVYRRGGGFDFSASFWTQLFICIPF
jgi:hypothetical protein